MDPQTEAVDFALAAYREHGSWVVRELAHDLVGDVGALAHALQRFAGAAGPAGAVGMVAVDEDFFVLLRVTGPVSGPRTRVLLSDITAGAEWELAESVVEFLGLPEPEDEDDQVPAGDLDLLGDLGMPAIDMAVLLDDVDLYPDEMLSDIARRIGFGELFDDAVGLTSA